MFENEIRNIHKELYDAAIGAGAILTPPQIGCEAEELQDYLERLAIAISNIPDAAWNAIPEWAQAWYTASANILNASWFLPDGTSRPTEGRQQLPMCPGLTLQGQAVEQHTQPPAARTAIATGKSVESHAAVPEVSILPFQADQAETRPETTITGPATQATGGASEGDTGTDIQQAVNAATRPEMPPLSRPPGPPQVPVVPLTPLEPRIPVIDDAFLFLAERFSDVSGRPSVRDIRDAIILKRGKKLSTSKLTSARSAFYKSVEALRAVGKMK